MKRTLAIAVLSTLALLPSGQEDGQKNPNESQAIARAALDYIEAIYEGRPELIERSVHPQVVKIGYGRSEKGDFPIRPMTYEKLLNLAENWSKGKVIPPDAKKDVKVLDRFHDIATVRLTASWGVDYMMLARSDGRWKIVQVLYQSNPKK